MHSANRPADPIQAPDSWIKKFSHIKNEGRRKYAAVTACLDDAIGKVGIFKEGIIPCVPKKVKRLIDHRSKGFC